VDPKGLGVAAILTEIFGLETTLDQETQDMLDKRNQLFAFPEKNRTSEQQKKLTDLTGRLADVPSIYSIRTY
jgi:hypothetical protein